jgi:hypothetical protein
VNAYRIHVRGKADKNEELNIEVKERGKNLK